MNFLARLLRNWDKILLISFTTMEVQCQDTGGWKGISRVAVVLFKNSSHTGIVNDLLTKESDSEQKDFTHFLFPEIILPNGNWWLIASGADLHNVFIVFPYRVAFNLWSGPCCSPKVASNSGYYRYLVTWSDFSSLRVHYHMAMSTCVNFFIAIPLIGLFVASLQPVD